MYSYWELAIIAFILIGIGWVIWKGGAANPIGTAGLDRSVRSIRQELHGFGDRLKTLEDCAASSDDLERLSNALADQNSRIERYFARLEAIEKQTATIAAVSEATSASVRAIDSRQDVMAEQLAAINVRSEATGRQVDRLYDFLTKKALDT